MSDRLWWKMSQQEMAQHIEMLEEVIEKLRRDRPVFEPDSQVMRYRRATASLDMTARDLSVKPFMRLCADAIGLAMLEDRAIRFFWEDGMLFADARVLEPKLGGASKPEEIARSRDAVSLPVSE